jgi:Fur family ferric uptake transcriptional regulator
MPTYKTQTRKMLLDYLQSHADETLSASIISKALPEISVSAVYRNLAALEKEGLLAAVREAGGRERYYRFTAAEQCRRHLHLSCKRCGKTFHMNEAETEELVRSIAALDRFAVDRSETVLYGVCEDCQLCK